MLMQIRLANIAHARSGDKADSVDFGLFAWNAAGYAVLLREVTANTVQAHFAPWWPGTVDCWPLANLLAIKLVLNVFTIVWLVGCAGWAIQVLWRV